jgi:hypothetical protein
VTVVATSSNRQTPPTSAIVVSAPGKFLGQEFVDEVAGSFAAVPRNVISAQAGI